MELLASRYEVLETVRRTGSNVMLQPRDARHSRLVVLKVYLLSEAVSRDDLLAEAGTSLRADQRSSLPTSTRGFMAPDVARLL